MKYSRMLLAATLMMTAATASAQQTSTALLNDGYFYRHEMNPAIQNEQQYVSLPFLGNLGVSLRGNVGLTDFIYARNGKTVTFMNPAVSMAEATAAFSDKLRLNTDFKMEVFSLGFKTGEKGYNTVNVNLRVGADMQLPGQLFRLAKEGPENKTYNLSNINAHADAFAEISYGHSHKVGEHLEVGGKAKFLLGLAAVDAYAKDCQVTLGEDRWEATTDARIETSLKGLEFESKTEMRGPEGQQTPHTYINSLDVDTPGLNGLGVAFDLGATYTLDEDWKFGLSLLDLGMIHWNNTLLASTDGPQHVSTDKYVFSVDDDDDNSFENEWERFGDGVSDLYELKDKGDQGGRNRGLHPTLNAFAEYKLPMYRKLSFGVMNTTRLAGDNTWTEFRLSANVAPVKWFSASVSGAHGTFGPAFGWMLNLHPKGFNLFAGMDYFFSQVNPQFIPLSKKCNLNVGINFGF